MAIVLVQHTSVSNNGAFSVNATFPVTTTSGNLIIVGSRIGDQGLTGITCTDDAGNNYQLATSSYFASLGYGYIFYARDVFPANTITVTVTGGATPTNRFIAHEYSGCEKVTPFDTATSQSQAGVTTASSGNITTFEANELLWGMVGVSNNRTITAGTNLAWTFDEQLPAGAGNGKEGVEHFVLGAQGTYSAQFTITPADDCVTTIAAFRQAVSSADQGAGGRRLLLGVGM